MQYSFFWTPQVDVLAGSGLPIVGFTRWAHFRRGSRNQNRPCCPSIDSHSTNFPFQFQGFPSFPIHQPIKTPFPANVLHFWLTQKRRPCCQFEVGGKSDVFTASRHQRIWTYNAKNRTNHPKWITKNANLFAIEKSNAHSSAIFSSVRSSLHYNCSRLLLFLPISIPQCH